MYLLTYSVLENFLTIGYAPVEYVQQQLKHWPT